MSETMVMLPLMAALAKTEDILGKDRKWNVVNNEQVRFLKDFFSKREELAKFSERDLRSWASFKAEELNDILKKEGFTIHLDKFNDGEFGVLAILHILVEWLERGELTGVRYRGNSYPAVKMKGDGSFSAFQSKRSAWPIAMIKTTSGDKVYLTVAGRAYKSFELISRIEEIRNDMGYARYDYLTFPMVDLNQESDIDWLRYLWTSNEKGMPFEINRALQQTKFKMNESGCSVKSAAVMVVRALSSTSSTRSLIIDRPFLLWMERPGVATPIMYGYIDEADWKNPGTLDYK